MRTRSRVEATVERYLPTVENLSSRRAGGCWERAVARTVNVATRFQLSASRKSAGDPIKRLRFGSKSGIPWQEAEPIRLGSLTDLLFAVGSIERYIYHLPF